MSKQSTWRKPSYSADELASPVMRNQ